MQSFHNKLRKAKNGRTIYQSTLAQLTQVSRAEIKRVGWYNW